MRLGVARFLDQTQQEVAQIKRVWRTQSWLERGRGLLGRKLEQDEGLWIDPCSSVHSLGMAYSIDLVYLDSDYRIVKPVANFRPFRASWCWRAGSILELPAGMVSDLNLALGMRMEWNDETG